MRVIIIDGQGGGIGAKLASALKAGGGTGVELVAVGTNVFATNAMLKAGAGTGATGENAVVFSTSKADVIVGPIGIVLANAMWGEITPAMAAAVSSAPARKVLVPSSKSSVFVAGVEERPLDAYIKAAVELVLRGDEHGG